MVAQLQIVCDAPFSSAARFWRSRVQVEFGTVKVLQVLAVSLGTIAAGSAGAATISLQDVTGTWGDATGNPSNLTGLGTSSVGWGVPFYSPAGHQSGYDFVGHSSNSISANTDFALGTFTHHNNPIVSGGSISGIKLSVSFNVSFDGSPEQTFNSVFDFSHLETNNLAPTCADGGANGQGVNANGCADRVMATVNPTLTQEFTFGNQVYTLTLSGFLRDGLPFDELWTMEEASNSALLLASFAVRDLPPAPVPLPAAGLLLGGAIAAMGLAAKRRGRAGSTPR